MFKKVLVPAAFIAAVISSALGETGTGLSDTEYLAVARTMSPGMKTSLYATTLGRIAYARGKDAPRFVLVTSDFGSFETGYRGPSVIAVAVDSNGTVLDAQFLECPDAEEYVRMVAESGYLRKFVGNTPASPNVEAVTGASFTTAGINVCIYAALDAFRDLRNRFSFKGNKLITEDKGLGLKKIR